MTNGYETNINHNKIDQFRDNELLKYAIWIGNHRLFMIQNN